MKQVLFAKLAVISLLISFLAVSVVPATVSAQPAPAATTSCGPAGFTLLPPWYKGLEKGCGQGIKSPAEYGRGLEGWIFRIATNVVEALLYLVGYISLGFIIWGGIKFMLYGDSAQGIAGARKTIQNAVIGLVISIFSVAIVNVVTGAFKI